MPASENEMICIANGAAAGGAGTPQRVYLLKTNDNATAVQTNGYFDGVFKNGLNPGDIIIGALNMGGTPSGRIYIVTVGGADVTIVDLNT